jgi:hypothetical protein
MLYISNFLNNFQKNFPQKSSAQSYDIQKFFTRGSRAQGSIENMLILGLIILVLGVVAVVIITMALSNSGFDTSNIGKGFGDIVDSFLNKNKTPIEEKPLVLSEGLQNGLAGYWPLLGGNDYLKDYSLSGNNFGCAEVKCPISGTLYGLSGLIFYKDFSVVTLPNSETTNNFSLVDGDSFSFSFLFDSNLFSLSESTRRTIVSIGAQNSESSVKGFKLDLGLIGSGNAKKLFVYWNYGNFASAEGVEGAGINVSELISTSGVSGASGLSAVNVSFVVKSSVVGLDKKKEFFVFVNGKNVTSSFVFKGASPNTIEKADNLSTLSLCFLGDGCGAEQTAFGGNIIGSGGAIVKDLLIWKRALSDAEIIELNNLIISTRKAK